MEDNVKKKLLLASLAKIVAERDEILYSIDSLLGSSYEQKNVSNVDSMVELLKKLSSIEITIESTQLFYARHYSVDEAKSEDGKEK